MPVDNRLTQKELSCLCNFLYDPQSKDWTKFHETVGQMLPSVRLKRQEDPDFADTTKEPLIPFNKYDQTLSKYFEQALKLNCTADDFNKFEYYVLFLNKDVAKVADEVLKKGADSQKKIEKFFSDFVSQRQIALKPAAPSPDPKKS